jgi:penicillin-binding protein 2
MRANVFDPNWVVHCTGSFDLGSMHMDLKSEKGDVTYLDALTHSYNTYFATLGLKIGRDVLLDTARSFNFGSPTHIVLPGELPGFIPDPESVRRMHQRDFGVAGGDTALTAIGQGDVLVTPLQMADFMACLANGGTFFQPRLVKDIEDRNGNVVKSFPVTPLCTVPLDFKYMPNLKEAMINVVDDGTATVVHRDDMKIAAKTGTAQVGSKVKRRQIAWLSGYLPADNPQYSFSVMVEGQFSDNRDDTETGGLLGGVEAGGIAKSIFDQVYPEPGKDKNGDQTVAADKDKGANEAADVDTDADADAKAKSSAAVSNVPGAADAAGAPSAAAASGVAAPTTTAPATAQ